MSYIYTHIILRLLLNFVMTQDHDARLQLRSITKKMRLQHKVFSSAAMAVSFIGAMCNVDTYDYVIVGAGTSGLVLANRLSADPSMNVAIIDPGADERGNPIVQNPTGWTRLWGSDVDWSYQCVPQGNLSSRVIDFHAGKGIGGTSLMNGEYDD